MVLARDLEKLISLMRRLYNVVIIDTSSAVDDVLLAFLDASDAVIQIVTYETVALHQARQFASTLAAAGFPVDKILYLVNRSDLLVGCGATPSKKQVGRKADFEVVSDGLLVVEANNRGEPFIKLGPDAAISRDVHRIAEELTSAAPGVRPGREREAVSDSRQIGFFDSGVGGLTVLREVVRRLPGGVDRLSGR